MEYKDIDNKDIYPNKYEEYFYNEIIRDEFNEIKIYLLNVINLQMKYYIRYILNKIKLVKFY